MSSTTQLKSKLRSTHKTTNLISSQDPKHRTSYSKGMGDHQQSSMRSHTSMSHHKDTGTTFMQRRISKETSSYKKLNKQ